MIAKPCPTPLEAPVGAESLVEEHRNLYCVYYDTCLTFAVDQDWRGWTCTRCVHFTRQLLKPDPAAYASAGRRE